MYSGDYVLIHFMLSESCILHVPLPIRQRRQSQVLLNDSEPIQWKERHQEFRQVAF